MCFPTKDDVTSGRLEPHSIHYGISNPELEELTAARDGSVLFLQRALEWESGRQTYWTENKCVPLKFYCPNIA